MPPATTRGAGWPQRFGLRYPSRQDGLDLGRKAPAEEITVEFWHESGNVFKSVPLTLKKDEVKDLGDIKISAK